MSGFFCRRSLQLAFLCRRTSGVSGTYSFVSLYNTLPNLTRSFSSAEEVKECGKLKPQSPGHSFTVSYLVKACGLSPESALAASKFVKFDACDRPDSVLSVLRSYGFTQNQIMRVVRSFPAVLVADPEGKVVPKLEFFRSIGFSTAESAKLISSCPRILARSLNNALVPWYGFLKNLLSQDEYVVKCLTRSFWLLTTDVQKDMVANVSALRSHGVPETIIKRSFTQVPHVLSCSPARFVENVKKVVSLGIEPGKFCFIRALAMFNKLQESTWEHKVEVYKRWGWSKDDVISAYKKFPHCMSLSEKKINNTMDFLVNKVGLSSEFLVTRPVLLGLSLEKRIAPRWLVFSTLVSEGVLKNKIAGYAWILMLTEEKFLERFVIKYKKAVPQLSDIYKREMRPEEPVIA